MEAYVFGGDFTLHFFTFIEIGRTRLFPQHRGPLFPVVATDDINHRPTCMSTALLELQFLQKMTRTSSVTS